MESKCKTHGSHLLSEVGPTACRCVQCLLQMQLKKHITFVTQCNKLLQPHHKLCFLFYLYSQKGTTG